MIDVECLSEYLKEIKQAGESESDQYVYRSGRVEDVHEKIKSYICMLPKFIIGVDTELPNNK